MNFRKLLIAGAAFVVFSAGASARDQISLSIGFGIPAPAYAAPAPVYYSQAQAYYPPPTAYYPPAYRAAPYVVYAPRVAWYPPSPYASLAHRSHHGPGRGYGGHR